MQKSTKEFLKSGTPESMMRLMGIRAVNTACFVALFAVVGTLTGVLLIILSGRDISVISGIAGAVLGGTAGIVGTLLLPAFGGKAAQSFAENQCPTPDAGQAVTNTNEGGK